MKLLKEASAGTTIRVGNIERKANQLLSELDSLDSRLHRAFEAASIDSFVAYLDTERKRMLEGERQAKVNAGWASYPTLGISLLSLFSGQTSNLKRVAASLSREEPFGDVRIAVSNSAVAVVNVSGMARERNMTVAGAVAYLAREGKTVFTWPEFEAGAEKLRLDILSGRRLFPDNKDAVDAVLEEVPVLLAGIGARVKSSGTHHLGAT